MSYDTSPYTNRKTTKKNIWHKDVIKHDALFPSVYKNVIDTLKLV